MFSVVCEDHSTLIGSLIDEIVREGARRMLAAELAEAPQARWRAVTAPHLVALARSGARFEHGQLVERVLEAAA
ncbi:hypothetical protein [Streptomyces brasiliensis]|uniref:Uncharacterized protein n=1 Tax=Streptomyces brasiliensis TaxID=1954 RepID=A0A917KUF9_9ACTN|nr:hypothetical protein GCM10010121_044670 [Streptomyces brasiliensis]